MKKLILTVGLPRSGKSTWAKEQGYPIVNPDSIRLTLHGYDYIQEAEPMVWTIAKYMVNSLFIAGHKIVIVDATNITKKRRDFWKTNIMCIDKWDIEYKLFNTSVEECAKRARDSGREDLLPVIEAMDQHKDFEGIE